MNNLQDLKKKLGIDNNLKEKQEKLKKLDSLLKTRRKRSENYIIF